MLFGLLAVGALGSLRIAAPAQQSRAIGRRPAGNNDVVQFQADIALLFFFPLTALCSGFRRLFQVLGGSIHVGGALAIFLLLLVLLVGCCVAVATFLRQTGQSQLNMPATTENAPVVATVTPPVFGGAVLAGPDFTEEETIFNTELPPTDLSDSANGFSKEFRQHTIYQIMEAVKLGHHSVDVEMPSGGDAAEFLQEGGWMHMLMEHMNSGYFANRQRRAPN